MIERYTDHAANERTMLAWVRTALAIAAFGFIIEKFNLLLRLSGLIKNEPSSSEKYTDLIGMFFVIAGITILVLSLFRFLQTSKAIEAPEKQKVNGQRTDIVLFGMLTILLIAMLVFLGHNLGMLR